MEMTVWQLNQMMPSEMKIHPSTARYDVANATSSGQLPHCIHWAVICVLGTVGIGN